MVNNISFQGKFQISQKMKTKCYYNQVLTKKNEKKLMKDFENMTIKSPYILELTDDNPITKYSLFTLKEGNNVLASRYAKFWNNPEKMKVENLLEIFEKLIIKKEYDEKLQNLHDYYQKTKKVLLKFNKEQDLAMFEDKYYKEIKSLNMDYAEKLGEILYG